VKRRDLVTELEKAGCQLLRHGSCHDIYHNPEPDAPNQFPAIAKSTSFSQRRF
jgi:hypothetical protein